MLIKKSSFISGSILSMIEQAISSGTSFLTSIILARNVDTGSVGVYTLLLSIAMIIMGLQRVFILVPFNVYYPKMIDLNEKENYAAKTMGFETIFLAVVLIVLLFLKFIGILNIQLSIISCSIFMVGYLLKDYTRQFLLGINKVFLSLLMGFIQSVFQLGLLLLLIYFNIFTLDYCLAIIGITTAISSVVFLGINTRISIRYKKIIDVWNKNKFVAKWSIGISMSDSVKNQISLWILNTFISTESVGIYSIHNTFAMLPQPIFSGLSQYLLPHFSKMFSEKKFNSMIKKSIIAISSVFFMNLAWGLVLLLMGKQLIILLYGKEYIGITIVLILCCIRGFFTSLISIVSSILQAIEKPHVILKSLIIGILILIVVSGYLTLKYSMVGMCIGLCVSFAAIAILQIIELIRIVNSLKVNKKEV